MTRRHGRPSSTAAMIIRHRQRLLRFRKCKGRVLETFCWPAWRAFAAGLFAVRFNLTFATASEPICRDSAGHSGSLCFVRLTEAGTSPNCHRRSAKSGRVSFAQYLESATTDERPLAPPRAVARSRSSRQGRLQEDRPPQRRRQPARQVAGLMPCTLRTPSGAPRRQVSTHSSRTLRCITRCNEGIAADMWILTPRTPCADRTAALAEQGPNPLCWLC